MEPKRNPGPASPCLPDFAEFIIGRAFARPVGSIRATIFRNFRERGLNYWAVSDLSADELTDFSEKFEAAMRTSGTG
jgi:hypothetical protein